MKITANPQQSTRHPMDIGDQSKAVLKVEQQLKKLGYDVGRVDGKYTRDTFDAVRDFKRDERSIRNDLGTLGERGRRILAERAGGSGGTGKDADVRFVSFNWPARYHKGGDAADEATFDRLSAKADVMGFSEFGWADNKVTDNEKNWAFHHPNPKNDGEKGDTGQLLAWRKDKFNLVEKGTTLMNKPTRVAPKAAGPTLHNGKSIIWAKLRHKKTGEIWTVAVAHFVPSKHLGGATEALWKKQRDAVAEWMKKQGPRTVIMGDFNGQWKDAIAKPLHKVGEVQDAPSHGRRKIDWILRSKDLDGVGPGRALSNGGQSDHRPVQGIVRG